MSACLQGAGEFTEILEPGHVGADVVMGSFIKNPGGTIATGGGYIAGRKDIIDTVVTKWSGQHEHVSNAQALLHGAVSCFTRSEGYLYHLHRCV